MEYILNILMSNFYIMLSDLNSIESNIYIVKNLDFIIE